MSLPNGAVVHFRDSGRCKAATVIGTCKIGVLTRDEYGNTVVDLAGKPKYTQRDGLEVEVIDNGGRYVRTLLRGGPQAPDTFHELGDCV